MLKFEYGAGLVWNPTDAERPSTMAFQGRDDGVVIRYRTRTGAMHVVNARPSTGFKCQCTITWNQCSDATLVKIKALTETGNTGLKIYCEWGTFHAKYVPGSFSSQHFLDDINTATLSFLEVENP